MKPMIDKLGRKINHLRISVTDRCNLSCFYCHHEGNQRQKKEMTTEEIKIILNEAMSTGIEEIKFTGGEPLLRKDIVELVKTASLLGFKDIAITTNGVYFDIFAEMLAKAGLKRANIGCDTITEKIHQNLPKSILSVKKGIYAAKKAGIAVKLNMVVLKGVNEDEIDKMISFCIKEQINLQLIELINSINLDSNNVYPAFHFSLSGWEKQLKAMSDMVITREMQGRKRYYFKGIYVEVVRPTNNFCKSCNKIRISSDGKIRPCLIKDIGITDFTGKDSIEKVCKERDFYGYD
jgi:cyclic pyranopterin phosphate synthase